MTHPPYNFFDSIEARLRSVCDEDPTGEVIIAAFERQGLDEPKANEMSLRWTGRPLVPNEEGDLVLGEFPEE